MAFQLIPTQPRAFWTQKTALDGVDYVLRFALNQSENAYYLSIQDVLTGQDVLSGIKLVCNYGLINRFNGRPGLPPGDIVASPQTDDLSPPGLGELGDRVNLIYIPQADL